MKMGRKLKVFCVLILFIFCAVLSGCRSSGKNLSRAVVDTSSGVKPRLMAVGGECIAISYGYSYLVDRNTGVVYLVYQDYNRYGITVMLNADGTPVTAKQLEISY